MAKTKALISGSNGFIGHHLCRFLKKKGYFVRGVDIKKLRWSNRADENYILDMRDRNQAGMAVVGMDEVYDLAADMGGMGYISKHHYNPLHNNALININTLHTAIHFKVKKYFFASSACVYPTYKQINPKSPPLKEIDDIPALPQGGYGWQKYVHELRAKAACIKYKIDVKIARFNNTYGPESKYEGERAKAPAALCAKVVRAKNEIQVWGDGKQTRTFIYIDDLLNGIYSLMQSKFHGPMNFGNEEVISINNLAKMIIKISGKKLKIRNVKGAEGVRGRLTDNRMAERDLKFKTKVPLEKGMKKLYQWVEKQVNSLP